ncbi:vasa protein [Trichuris trichiura]|uniref:RNA helicase n=1 Tax=Trichuris trichiura TaxID=36087 RepID=A0A077ZD77_TRITR|nr:vasa protein [Trichuris trichiura]
MAEKFGFDSGGFDDDGYENRSRDTGGGGRRFGGYSGNQRSRGGGGYERNYGRFGGESDGDGRDSGFSGSHSRGGGSGFRNADSGDGFRKNDRNGDFSYGFDSNTRDDYRDSDRSGGFSGRGYRGRGSGRNFRGESNRDNDRYGGGDRFNGNEDSYGRRERSRPFSSYENDDGSNFRRSGTDDTFSRNQDGMRRGRGRNFQYDNRSNDGRNRGFSDRSNDGDRYGGRGGGGGGFRSNDDFGGGFQSHDDFGGGFGSGERDNNDDYSKDSFGNDRRRNDGRGFRDNNRNYDDDYSFSGRDRAYRGRGSFEDGGGFRGRGRSRGREDNSAGSFERREATQGQPKPPVNYVPSKMTEEEMRMHIRAGVNFENQLRAKVETIGQDCPEPMESFREANFHELIMEHLKKSDINVPTVIQRYGIPVVTAGRDYMACAQTGSGKTAVYLLPILDSIVKNNDGLSSRRCTALVLVPTRELAIQINTVGMNFLRETQYRTVAVYGGVSVMYQSQSIRKGCDIVVGTPGRLCDFIKRGYIQLSGCRYFVVDEADRLLDMGFENDFRFIAQQLESIEHQTMMFSATFPPAIQSIAKEFLKSDFIFQIVGNLGGANKDITQEVLPVTMAEKQAKLEKILGERFDNNPNAKILVFVGRKRVADFVAASLAHTGWRTTSIHGDREQMQRETALRGFKSGANNVLIATEVAARGLDIAGVDLVVNYDLPSSIDDYVHRIGRTGRVGNPGKATSFYDEVTDAALASELVETLRLCEQEVPDFLTSRNDGFATRSQQHQQDNYSQESGFVNSFDDRRSDDFDRTTVTTKEKEEVTDEIELEDNGW